MLRRILLLLMVFTQILLAREYVAVLEFDGSGMSKIEARNVTERFSYELSQTDKFNIIERQQLDLILDEQKTQLSGCIADECAVQIGELVGARYVIAGSVTKTFGLYGIAVRLIDVESGEIITHILESDEADVQKFVSQRVRNAALRMAAEGGSTNGQSGDGAVTISSSEKGSVVFTLNKSGAAVFVDDAYTTQASSQTVSFNLTEGSHQMKFTLPGQRDWVKQLSVLAGETLNYEVTFESGTSTGGAAIDYGIVMVRSEPTEAIAYLDGVELGPTPAQNTKVGVGKHLIRVEKPLYHPYVEEIIITSDGIEQVQADLKPRFGRLVIKSAPTGAVIQLNRQQKGRTPIDLPELASGDYTITVSKDLYHDSEEKYTITDGSDNERTVVLHPAFGQLNVEANPKGADVFVDGQFKGKAPITLDELPSGAFRLKVSQDLYETLDKEVTIEDGKTNKQVVVLSPRFGTLNITGSPASAQVSINGKTVGSLPLVNHQVGTGLAEIKISAKNYHGNEQFIQVDVNEKYPVNVDLVHHLGTIIAISNPPEAMLRLDGVEVGLSPQILKQVPTGPHSLVFAHPDFLIETREFKLSLDERMEFNIKLVTYEDKGSESMTDLDGNIYQTIRIGNQVWMAENLKVTHYRDGTLITQISTSTAWLNLSTEAYCIYNNNASNEVDTYGALYNWYAATDSRHIAPEGWHVPTDDEWKELEMALGMSQSEADDTGWRGTNEGSKLAGIADLWNNGALENNSAFGSSGFTALPGGYRSSYGYYDYLGNFGYFWSATESSSTNAWYRLLYYYFSDVSRYDYDKRHGFSVRCVRD